MIYLIHLLIYTYEFYTYLFIHISADYSRSIGRLNTTQWIFQKYVFNVDQIEISILKSLNIFRNLKVFPAKGLSGMINRRRRKRNWQQQKRTRRNDGDCDLMTVILFTFCCFVHYLTCIG